MSIFLQYQSSGSAYLGLIINNGKLSVETTNGANPGVNTTTSSSSMFDSNTWFKYKWNLRYLDIVSFSFYLPIWLTRFHLFD